MGACQPALSAGRGAIGVRALPELAGAERSQGWTLGAAPSAAAAGSEIGGIAVFGSDQRNWFLLGFDIILF